MIIVRFAIMRPMYTKNCKFVIRNYLLTYNHKERFKLYLTRNWQLMLWLKKAYNDIRVHVCTPYIAVLWLWNVFTTTWFNQYKLWCLSKVCWFSYHFCILLMCILIRLSYINTYKLKKQAFICREVRRNDSTTGICPYVCLCRGSNPHQLL